MASTANFEQHMQNLREAIRTEHIDRRTFTKVAAAAAAAMGLAGPVGFASAAPAPGSRIHRARGQADINTFIVGSGQDISNLDPHTGHDYSIAWGQKACYDSLLRYSGVPSLPVPHLATEFVGNTDATEFDVTLTDLAKFHDGSAVTAEAVQYNFQRMLRKNLGVAYMFADFMTQDSVTVVDPTHLKITLTKPFAPFEAVVPWLFIANPAVIDANAGDDEGETYLLDHEAGSGPYTIGKWELGSSYEFNKWADYWWQPEDVTMVDTLVWSVIREASSRRISMEAGEAHYVDFLTAEDYQGLQEGGFDVNTESGIGPFAIKLNNATGPTSDVNVRAAILQSFDYESALQVVSGFGEVMQGPLATNMKPWHDDSLVTFKYDLEGAKASLAASGYPDGFDLEYVYVADFSLEEQWGLILLAGCAELGINVKMTPLVWPDMVARAADPATAPGAMAVYSGTDYLDPDNFLYASYHSSQAGTWSAASQYNNPDVDALLDEGRSTVDQERRIEIYNEIQQKLVADSVEIWVYVEIPLVAIAPGLAGNVLMQVMGGDAREFGWAPTT